MLLVVANISVLNSFIINNSNNISLSDFNNFFSTVESYLNQIASKINKKGVTMKLSLVQASSFIDIVEVYNTNIDSINKFLLKLDDSFKASTIYQNDLLVTDLKFVNDSMQGSVVVNADNVKIDWIDITTNKNFSVTLPDQSNNE